MWCRCDSPFSPVVFSAACWSPSSRSHSKYVSFATHSWLKVPASNFTQAKTSVASSKGWGLGALSKNIGSLFSWRNGLIVKKNRQNATLKTQRERQNKSVALGCKNNQNLLTWRTCTCVASRLNTAAPLWGLTSQFQASQEKVAFSVQS